MDLAWETSPPPKVGSVPPLPPVGDWNPQDPAGSPLHVLRVRSAGPRDRRAPGVPPAPGGAMVPAAVRPHTHSLSGPGARLAHPGIPGTFLSLPGGGPESAQVFPWEPGAREGVRGCAFQGHPAHAHKLTSHRPMEVSFRDFLCSGSLKVGVSGGGGGRSRAGGEGMQG